MLSCYALWNTIFHPKIAASFQKAAMSRKNPSLPELPTSSNQSSLFFFVWWVSHVSDYSREVSAFVSEQFNISRKLLQPNWNSFRIRCSACMENKLAEFISEGSCGAGARPCVPGPIITWSMAKKCCHVELGWNLCWAPGFSSGGFPSHLGTVHKLPLGRAFPLPSTSSVSSLA